MDYQDIASRVLRLAVGLWPRGPEAAAFSILGQYLDGFMYKTATEIIKLLNVLRCPTVNMITANYTRFYATFPHPVSPHTYLLLNIKGNLLGRRWATFSIKKSSKNLFVGHTLIELE